MLTYQPWRQRLRGYRFNIGFIWQQKDAVDLGDFVV